MNRFCQGMFGVTLLPDELELKLIEKPCMAMSLVDNAKTARAVATVKYVFSFFARSTATFPHVILVILHHAILHYNYLNTTTSRAAGNRSRRFRVLLWL